MRGKEHCIRYDLGQRGAQCAIYSMTQVVQQTHRRSIPFLFINIIIAPTTKLCGSRHLRPSVIKMASVMRESTGPNPTNLRPWKHLDGFKACLVYQDLHVPVNPLTRNGWCYNDGSDIRLHHTHVQCRIYPNESNLSNRLGKFSSL